MLSKTFLPERLYRQTGLLSDSLRDLCAFLKIFHGKVIVFHCYSLICGFIYYNNKFWIFVIWNSIIFTVFSWKKKYFRISLFRLCVIPFPQTFFFTTVGKTHSGQSDSSLSAEEWHSVSPFPCCCCCRRSLFRMMNVEPGRLQSCWLSAAEMKRTVVQWTCCIHSSSCCCCCCCNT